MTQPIVLIEVFTEELPPKALKKLGESFSSSVFDQLAKQQFVSTDVKFTEFATPRRLGVSIPNVLAVQPEQKIERKGPAVASAYKDGQPTPALQGFAKSCGVEIDKLEKMSDGKQDVFVFRSTKPGASLDAVLAGVVEASLKQLPAPKLMRWGSGDVQFMRPVHGLIMMHGSRVVPGEVLGLKSGNTTYGHRFLSSGALTISSADQYETILEAKGSVIASFAKRRAKIAAKLKPYLAQEPDATLLDEVTALVESPAVYVGTFDPAFLDVPQECLILSMKQHQKYFPITDASGKLQPRFAVVSNLPTATPQEIIHGNERVLRARLSDAQFFYQQDKKTKLAARVEKLGNVVYHNKFGSQLQRVQRLQKLAGEIARKLGADVSHADRAAYLCKADLLTDMVGEFPELQGIMGRYYALNDGEPAAVADAIQSHYLPRGGGDGLPQDKIAISVALAEKLDTLTGIYGIGLVPTGDKDPFGLRRAALGVLRILIENKLALDVNELLQLARGTFPRDVLADSVSVDLHGFMLERLKNYLREKDFAPDEIDAVISQNPTRMDLIIPRMEAVRAFRKLPESASLAAANKRIRNILKKSDANNGAVNASLMADTAEKNLFCAMQKLSPQVGAHMQKQDYTHALKDLAGVRGEVDKFFDDVMVMHDDPAVRNNRIALLRQLDSLMNQVADISKLAAS
ncbi:MAG: glycine--tRNA ligase subunit beta [Burkholderiales bacterium]